MEEIEALRTTFLTTGVLATLDSAIALAFTTLSAAPPDTELPLLHLLASLLDLCYETTHLATDLLNAIQVLEAAIEATPSTDARRPGMQHNLGVYHAANYTHTGDATDMTKAVLAAEAAVAATPAEHPHRATMCTSLAMHLSKTCDVPGAAGLAALDRAIWASRAAIAATPDDAAGRVLLLNNLGGFLSNRFAREGKLEDVDGAIEAGERAVAAAPEGHQHRPTMLANLSTYLSNRFDRTGGIEDLIAAIECREKALAVTLLDHPGRAGGLTKLAYRLHCRYERTGAAEDLDNAIRASEDAVSATPPEHADRASRLGSLSCYLTARFTLRDQMADLDRAVAASSAAAAASPPGHSQRATTQTNLGSILSTRFQRLGAPADLAAAIVAGDAAVAETAPRHPLRAHVLNNSSSYYTMRFDHLGGIDDLQTAVAASEAAVECTPPGHPLRACMLNALSSRLSKRFTILADLHDLETAVELLHDALALPGSSDTHLRASMLDNLSISHRRLHTRLGHTHDLDAAIRASRSAVAETPASHPDRASILNNLGNALHTRFESHGALADLQSAIATSTAAIAATKIPADRAVRLSNLACSLAQRFERVGDLADLDRAVASSAAALAGLLRATDPRRAAFVGQLANQLHLRFVRLGTLEDVEAAIVAGREAVDATPEDHPERAGRCSNLACYLADRYERVGEMADLQAAIGLAEEAVAAIPRDHPDRVVMVSNLGNRWLSRFRARRGSGDEVRDVDSAIEAAAEAVAATPLRHPERPRRLNNLGNGYLSRFEALGERADLDSAVRACDAAIDETPDDHPERGHMLLLLATALNLRSAAATPADDRSADFDRALAAALQAWNSTTSPPRFRILAARLAGALLSSRDRWTEVSTLLDAAVVLLPNVSPQFLRRDDQEHLLSQFTDLASSAAASALHAGSTAAHCLALLELSRGIIMGFTIACRSDESELQRTHPAAWTRFSQLRAEIDSALAGNDENRRRRRVHAVREFDDTVAQIRRIPGRERFQMAPSEEELIAIAAGGSTIVVVNSTPLRSDALIVTPAGITTLRLPTMVHADVAARMAQLPQLVRGKRSTHVARNRELSKTLLWLWDVGVGPVCEELGLRPAEEGGDLPRLTWIGVGALANAPFHAAGDHTRGSTNNTLSRAVSSYIATIKALSYARQKDLDLDADSRLLVVTMSTTPDTPATLTSPAVRWSALAGAAMEADDIAAVVPHTSRLRSPTTAAVRAVLPDYHVIHFACHGVSDSVHPSNSYLLLLANDAADPSSARLTVGEISGMTMRTAQIAYLSACSTAANAAARLADEVIHIAGGFQLAGFAHVLATMWQGSDECCRRVAGEFYRRLFRQRVGGHRAVAEAFHAAVVVLREVNREQPVKWASFIHTGA